MAAWLLAGLALLQSAPDPRVLQHVRAGLAARESNRLEDAARELGEAARLAPAIAEIHLNLGLVHHRRQDWKAAVSSLETAFKLNAKLRGVRDLLGFDYLMLGSLGPAKQNLETALAEDSGNTDARLWLGLAEIELAEYRAATDHLELVRKARPKDPDVLFYLGRCYDRLAAQARDDLLAAAPDSARAHMAAAEFAAFNGRPKEAIQEYEQVIRINPKLPGIHAAIAELHADANEFDKAEAAYQEELKLAPQNARNNYRYGLVLANLGQADQAITHLERAVTIEPGLIDAQLQLGKVLLQQGQLERAEKALLAVVAAEASRDLKRTAHYQLGLLYRKQNRAAEAARQMQIFERLKTPE
ncbi:MAG: tetratricopeptide repeat protein [Acidobacteria bacterium]|nr:tetratricopeptide repeat protein [Acidobacteriota bacterium]